MKQSSWACTIFIQLSLCLAIYVSLHLGHSFLVSDRNLNNANGRHLDLSFISVSGGFRSLHRQTHLLKLMGRVVKSYNARFVVSISEFGDKDPLFRNATRVSSSLKLPWFTTGASRESESGNFMKRFKLPLGGTLDIVFIGNGSSRKGLANEVSRVSGISRLNELRRTLEVADADWRIVVGSDPLIIYEQHKEAKQVNETLHQILINNGVNVYLSDKGCINEANHSGIACIAVPTTTDSAREMEDGFLLHRVSFSDLVTYFFNSSGQVIDTRFIKQKGNAAISTLSNELACASFGILTWTAFLYGFKGGEGLFCLDLTSSCKRGAAYHLSSLRQDKKASKPEFPLPLQTHYFPQILDHFSFRPESYRIFYQKYLINSHFWHKGCPIFVYTGNEGDIEWFASNTGFMFDIAPKFQALLVFIEHRFYGESLPFGKKSYKSAETLGYLNSRQALADFAVLIRSLKQNLSSEASPVVVFGGSYGGMLAAWFRLKYPHVALGALASSAPILQFDNIVPSTSFYDAISQDFKDASVNCFNVIKRSWAELDAFSTMKDGLTKLSKIFRTCKDLQFVSSAIGWLQTAFVYTAMVNYPTEADFMAPLPAYPVEQMCKIIDRYPRGASDLERTFAAASLYYNYSGSEKCFDIEHEDDAHGLSGWGWQACTEMVMPMSCSNRSMFPPFDDDYKGFEESCVSKYRIKPRPHWITTEFGGQRIELVLKRFSSNIIFSNGMQDPWSRGGVLKNISSSIIALVTKRGAHHGDLRASTKEDPKWLKEQRMQEVGMMQKWINEYYSDFRHEHQ